jgi:hypothetical protein
LGEREPGAEPGIVPVTFPAIAANATTTVFIPVTFPEPYPPGGVLSDAFNVEGTYTDRAMVRPYPIIKPEAYEHVVHGEG